MSEDTATTAEQDYLETIFWLEEAGLPVTGANIARAMQLSPPTVHEMIGRLEDDGYVIRAQDKSLEFTESGRELAAHLVYRHRLIERFLNDVLQIPWHESHEAAEKLERGMTPLLEERMMAAVGDATTCPHGHPFVADAREPGAPLSDVSEGATIEVLRFENEAEDILRYLYKVGLNVGSVGKVEGSGKVVEIDAGGETIKVKRDVAETVSVKADPSPPLRTGLPVTQLSRSKRKYGR